MPTILISPKNVMPFQDLMQGVKIFVPFSNSVYYGKKKNKSSCLQFRPPCCTISSLEFLAMAPLHDALLDYLWWNIVMMVCQACMNVWRLYFCSHNLGLDLSLYINHMVSVLFVDADERKLDLFNFIVDFLFMFRLVIDHLQMVVDLAYF